MFDKPENVGGVGGFAEQQAACAAGSVSQVVELPLMELDPALLRIKEQILAYAQVDNIGLLVKLTLSIFAVGIFCNSEIFCKTALSLIVNIIVSVFVF